MGRLRFAPFGDRYGGFLLSPFLLSAGKPVLPPGLRNLPVDQVMAMELVGFPHPDDVGVCFTQVASPTFRRSRRQFLLIYLPA
jgi:hypothetical protein